MCVHIYIYIYTYIIAYVYICIYTYYEARRSGTARAAKLGCTSIMYLSLSLSLSLSIYLSIYISLSLSLYIYIYIYIHTYVRQTRLHKLRVTRQTSLTRHGALKCCFCKHKPKGPIGLLSFLRGQSATRGQQVNPD